MSFPEYVDQQAAVVVRLSTRIAAPVERVWALHTGIGAWPDWNPGIDSACLTGPLSPGAEFRWQTAGMTIDSTVYAVEAPHRILWGGPAHGITGIHSWTFTTDGDATVVHTEESWDGDPVRADPENLRHALEESLRAWLEALRTTAETAA